jgi:hypothetical protein
MIAGFKLQLVYHLAKQPSPTLTEFTTIYGCQITWQRLGPVEIVLPPFGCAVTPAYLGSPFGIHLFGFRLPAHFSVVHNLR